MYYILAYLYCTYSTLDILSFCAKYPLPLSFNENMCQKITKSSLCTKTFVITDESHTLSSSNMSNG